jgi:iron complex outermembrane receptor protein
MKESDGSIRAQGGPQRWNWLLALGIALGPALGLGLGAAAQDTPPPADEPAQEEPVTEERITEEITVTGTRVEGRSATSTPAPVDYIDSVTIRSTGAVETGKILQQLAPSFNFTQTTISDGTDIIRPATLRALGPDQLLVLVNGKRRHQQALLNVQQTIGRGSAGYDLNAIPAAAIDHIEVLRDGAAAQYGSDAIAGVINIILKDDADSLDVSFDAGQFYEGDGETYQVGANKGFSLFGDGTLSVTASYRDRSETNRAGADSLRVNPPRVTQRIGDADATDASLWLNFAKPTENGRFYGFGGWSNREGNSSGFFRSAGDGRTIPQIYPNGFLPTIITEPTDLSLVVGYDGKFNDAWKYDVSANWGQSEFQFREENTANVSWFFEPVNPNNPNGQRFNATPTEADTGTLTFDMLSFNFDITGLVEWGVGQGPLYLATGAEFRTDGFQIEAGDPVSYTYGRTDNRNIQIFDQNGGISQPGTQGFPGWSPSEEVDESRDNVSVYVDAESQLTDKFLLGAAVRFEDYSDFGSTVTGKLSGRLDVNDKFSLRSTLSTGFRAPSVQQQFYSQRSTNLNAAGILTDTLTARQGSAVARAFGIPDLKEETSINYGLGFVAKPNDRVRLTLDLYRIAIDDRIIFSSNIQPESGNCGNPVNPALCPIRAILDPLAVGQVLFFTNAIDTETDGADLVISYDHPYANESLLSIEGAFHVNSTEVTERRSPSTILPAPVLFDETQITLIEEGQPGERAVLSTTYYRGRWNANVRFNYFGEVAGQGFTPGFIQTWGAKVLTDIAFTYDFNDAFSVTIGGLNVTDEFPDKWDPVNAFPFPQLGFTYGWETLPFGINGGYYFTRLNFKM